MLLGALVGTCVGVVCAVFIGIYLPRVLDRTFPLDYEKIRREFEERHR